MAHGSLEETRYYLHLSRDLGYCQVSDLLMLAEEVSKLLTLYFRNIAAN
jgi:four helix bundle protein